MITTHAHLRPIGGCACARCAALARGEDDPWADVDVDFGDLGDAWLAFVHLAAAVAYGAGVRTRTDAPTDAGPLELLILFFINGHELPARVRRIGDVYAN